MVKKKNSFDAQIAAAALDLIGNKSRRHRVASRGNFALAQVPRLHVFAPEIFFVFFQAEDGIRDLTVTGVQTCALPIYPMGAALENFTLVSEYRIIPTLKP